MEPESKVDIAICSTCGWRGSVDKCELIPMEIGKLDIILFIYVQNVMMEDVLMIIQCLRKGQKSGMNGTKNLKILTANNNHVEVKKYLVKKYPTYTNKKGKTSCQ